jgi:G3E family GTPase
MNSMLDLFPSRAAGPFGRRLKHARGERIPVTIVTGFLGAGKTTLVRRFLETPQGRGTAVVINEFGAIGIDDALVRASTDEVTLMGNGCLCCTTRSDLQITLRRLVSEREQGTLPPFSRILIETSGLADPGPILQTFATDRALGGEFFVEVVAAVIDASCGLATLHWSAEARKQVILADRLVISKTDLCAPEAIAQLTARLAALNGYAPIDAAIGGVLDPQCLIEAGPEGPQPHAGLIGEAGHSEGIVSFVLSEPQPLAWPPFERAMETLIALRGSDLLRVKGFLNVAGCRGPVLVQIVQHLAHPPLELASWPDADHSSRLVFITRNISQERVEAFLLAVRALAAEAPLNRVAERVNRR